MSPSNALTAGYLALLMSTAAAADATSYARPEVPWQKPWARQADNATVADRAATAGTSSYANSAGSVGANGITGLPSCTSGTVLTISGGAFTCVSVTAAGPSCTGVLVDCYCNNYLYMCKDQGCGAATIAYSPINPCTYSGGD